MALIFRRLKARWAHADMLIRIMGINLICSSLLWILHWLLLLANCNPFLLDEQLCFSPDVYELLRRPWTFLSYMWVHSDFFHLFFNLLWLYYFGRIFLRYQNPRRLLSLYLMGGLAGALLYLLLSAVLLHFAPELFPLPLMGSSAAVMAIVFGISFYAHHEKVSLLFLGPVKLYYLALLLFVLDLLLLGGNNYGGHIAHIGGALLGFAFAYMLHKGKDISLPMQRLLDTMVNLFQRLLDYLRQAANYISRTTKKLFQKQDKTVRKSSGKERVERAREATEQATDAKGEQAKMDAILAKIRLSGYESLSAEERKLFFSKTKSSSERK